jgi:hypothetical protein
MSIFGGTRGGVEGGGPLRKETCYNTKVCQRCAGLTVCQIWKTRPVSETIISRLYYAVLTGHFCARLRLFVVVSSRRSCSAF